MSTPMNDDFGTDDIVEAEHIQQVFAPLGDLEEGQAFFREDIGVADAYKVDFSGSGANKNEIAAYKDGQMIVFKAAAANTGAATLQVVGPAGDLSAKPIVKNGNVALAAGDVQAGQMVAVLYNEEGSGRFEMVSAAATINASQIGSGSVSDVEFGYLNGATSSIQAQLDSKGSSLGSTPIGLVSPFAGSTAPSGWLLCAGQAVSRSTYATLFTVLGTTYGAGNGSTTFNLPDLRGRVVSGLDNMGGTAANRVTNSGTGNPGINGVSLGASGGADRHQLSIAQMPSHQHGYEHRVNYWYYSGTTTADRVARYDDMYEVLSTATGGSQAHPNCQPTMVLNYIVFAGV